MHDFEKLGVFYLGRSSDVPLLYDSKDLVTHAVCVGMTGSGKTGLCVDLLEEAAIDSVPAIVVDPKGDLGNLLLQFPDLKPEDFEAWVNEDDAKRLGISKAEHAAQQAQLWRDGLAKWGQSGERIRRLQSSADFSVYTPGSNAGIPLSLVKSFAAPSEAMRDDRELMRERISTTATALLGLLGIEAEPMKSREHILLSTIFDASWREGRDLSLAGLIQLIQHPPVQRLGVLELEAVYPEGDRFDLAMQVNHLLASPGFEAWLEGEPLDIGKLLHTPEGKPRISIISIAHLPDSERMFFVSLLLNEVLGWTRMQPGTTSLRAIVYMDEIFGYFPPVSNPPSKRPLLTLLKQARAFGVGIVLATQNPVDLDYKGLANCGTWFIGRLQTDRDKDRLLEGLEGASNEGGVQFDRARMDQTLSSLGKRMFLMNNVHDDGPVVFESRWALSYLRGPMTRAQIKELMKDRKPAVTATAPAARVVASPASAVGQRVLLPPDIPQAFVPARSAEGLIYQPMVLGVAQARFSDAKSRLDIARDYVMSASIADTGISVQWDQAIALELDPADLEKQPEDGAVFEPVPAVAQKAKSYAGWSKDLASWIYGTQSVTLHYSPSAKVYSQPEESEGDFRVRLSQSTREKRDEAVAKLRQKYAPKIAALVERKRKAEQAVERERAQAQQETLSTVLSAGSGLLGALFGRKTLTKATIGAAAGAARGAGRVRQQSMDVGRAQETVAAMDEQIAALEADLRQQVEALTLATDPSSEVLETCVIKPKKTNIQVRLITLAWMPFYRDQSGQLQAAWE